MSDRQSADESAPTSWPIVGANSFAIGFTSESIQEAVNSG